MDARLTKKEAIEFVGLDEKTFDNFFKIAGEFPAFDRSGGRGRFYFDKDILEKWNKNRQWRTVELDREDYGLCLDFALAQHFRGYVLSDWGSSRQREFGQKISNWMRGQLGEVGVQKFLKKEFNLEVELDFEIRDAIVAQDITGIKENDSLREPKIGVGIKASKEKSASLILSENEVNLDARRSDVYIFCRVALPDDHLLRIDPESIRSLVKDGKHYESYRELLPSFTPISCEVAGWVLRKDLEYVEAKTIHGLDTATGFRYLKKSGDLRKSKESWEELVRMI